MSKAEKFRVPDCLKHILGAIQQINIYIRQTTTEKAFLENKMVQDAVIRNLEIIGEAARNIERHQQDFATQHPEIPLGFAYEMRNVLAHGYFQVDLEIVWKTIRADLPGLEAQVRKLLGNH